MNKNSNTIGLLLILLSSAICDPAVPLYPDTGPKVIKKESELHYQDDAPDELDPQLLKDSLREMGMEHPDYKEEEVEVTAHGNPFKKKQKKRDYLIVKLRDPSYIIEDITHGLKVVLFVENDKLSLKNKDSAQSANRKRLIEKLKEERDEPDVLGTAFYFTNCEFLNNLCYEMKINENKNEIAHIAKFKSKTFSLEDPRLVEDVWEHMSQTLRTVANIDALNRLIGDRQINVILFNIDGPGEASEKQVKYQRERALRLVEKCKKDCFNDVEFVEISEKDPFLNHAHNRGKTFMMRKGELIETPFKLRGAGKMALNKTLKMINNEGLDDVLDNNNENYFRIYQNDLKAMLVLMLNTKSPLKREMLLDEFTHAAKKHRQYRSNFEDRYTFVVLDLNDSEPHYRNMMLEVTGPVTGEAEVFMFHRGGGLNKFENYRLGDNVSDIHGFFSSLTERIHKYTELKEKEARIKEKQDASKESKTQEDDDMPDVKNFDPVELASLEMGNLYLKDWQALDSVLKVNDDESSDISVRNLLGFINTSDLGLLSKQFFKSAVEDREHNDRSMLTGILGVTGDSFDRLVFGVDPGAEEYSEVHHSFILVVCRNHSDEDEQDCQRVAKLVAFLRKHFPREEAQVRIGVMDHTENDHPAVDRFDIKHFPVLIFFGKKDRTGRGKIFRGELVVDKVFRWLNKKFIAHEDAIVELNEKHYHDLLLEMAKTEK